MTVKQISPLARKECVPCRAGTKPLQGEGLQLMMAELGGGWDMIDEKRLQKNCTFRDFQEALVFANAVGRLAQQANHHPEITIGWGLARITLWTHKIGGLSEADFVLAAKIDAL